MIKNVKYKGIFNGIEKTLEFDNLAILIGVNGSGKTTLLNLLYLTLTFQPHKLWSENFEEMIIYFDQDNKSLKKLKVIKKSSNLNSLVTDKQVTELLFEYTLDKVILFVKVTDKEIHFEQKSIDGLVMTKTGYVLEEFSLNEICLILESITKKEGFKEELENIKSIIELKNSVIYFPTYRNVGSNSKEKNNFNKSRAIEQVNGVDITLLLESNYINNRKLLDKIASKLIDSSDMNIFTNRDKEIQEYISEYKKNYEQFERVQKTMDLFFKNKVTLLDNNKSWVLSKEYDALSTGQKQVIMMLMYSAFSKDSTLGKRILIIDEPELSLHIQWQSQLIQAIKRVYKDQIIISTHSPYIANGRYKNSIKVVGDIDGYN